MSTIYDALGRGPVHPFPARMAAGVALKSMAGRRRRLRILDPMMGSGTVVALARAGGHRAFGIDIDPLAVLITKVWTTPVNPRAIEREASIVLVRARRILRGISQGDAYPEGADEETRQFVRYWFDGYARRQLTALSRAIAQVRSHRIRNVLWCSFSRLIITKQAGASLAKDLAHSRPHRSFDTAPLKPLANFLTAVKRVLENCILSTQGDCGPNPIIRQGDARKLKIPDASIDLVLTSPPYLNAIDYVRCSKFSLVWMGAQSADLRYLRSQSVGSELGVYEENPIAARILKTLRLESRLSNRHRAILRRFIKDMSMALSEVSRTLVPGGRAIYVIGDNTIRGTYVKNSEIIIAVARRAGLVLASKQTRRLPPSRRYLPPPGRKGGAAMDSRMRREVILHFRKPRMRHGL